VQRFSLATRHCVRQLLRFVMLVELHKPEIQNARREQNALSSDLHNWWQTTTQQRSSYRSLKQPDDQKREDG